MYSGSGSVFEAGSWVSSCWELSAVCDWVRFEYGWWRDLEFLTPLRVLAIELSGKREQFRSRSYSTIGFSVIIVGFGLHDGYLVNLSYCIFVESGRIWSNLVEFGRIQFEFISCLVRGYSRFCSERRFCSEWWYCLDNCRVYLKNSRLKWECISILQSLDL